ncbi:RidA family protein [uncultured Campylobacter sp.]|uniref:RidA family protein n=1 Tax=uncultured Campylobacter sp. TaxID=218934 RepID=UPI0026174975|nr:RidA family protein [uncultured Campylobacter sp.]
MQIISTPDAAQAIGPYSQAIKAGGFIFTSGQIALKPDGEFVVGGVEAQSRQVLQNLAAILEEAGATLQDAVKTTIFLADIGDFAAVNEIYAAAFGAHKPARSTVQVAKLPKGALVEIEVIALAK